MSDELDQYISGRDKGLKKSDADKGIPRTPGCERPVQISVLKRGPIAAESGRIMRPAKVISMIERLEHKSMLQAGSAKNGPIKQEFRMSAGQMAYLNFRRQQRQIRLRKVRRDLVTLAVSLMLLLSSAYITYQVTSAWFTNRPVTIGTLIGDDAANRVQSVKARIFSGHHLTANMNDKIIKKSRITKKSNATVLNTTSRPSGEAQ